jgi:hypothetical protein
MVEGRLAAMKVLYAESRRIGGPSGAASPGNLHAIDNVLEASELMLGEGDVQGAQMMREARTAIAEGRIQDAEALIRAVVAAY